MALLNPEQKQDEDDFRGSPRPIPGRYHAAVQFCQRGASREKGTPCIQVEYAIVTEGLLPDKKTPTSEQTGRTISASMYFCSEKGDKETTNCLNQLALFCRVVGLLGPAESKDTDDIEWGEAIGRELVIEVKSRKYTDKGGNEREGSEVGFMGFWSLGNKAVTNVPKDPGSPGMRALAKSGGPVNHPAGGNETQAAGAGNAPPTPPPAGGGWKSWKDTIW